MAIEYVRISQQGKDKLMRLKRVTGIEHWNTICRWAFCASLSDPSIPSPVKIPTDNALELEWKTFGGSHHELYYALLKQRCHRDGLGTSEETLAMQFRLHLHRGIGYLAANKEIKSIAGLLNQAIVLHDN
jgi:DNA sulfur modification protein DndE